MATAEDIAKALATHGLGTLGAASGWSININHEPDSPNSTITIYDTPGADPSPQWRLDFPSFQVRVRGDVQGSAAARTKIDAIKAYLLGIYPTTLNSNYYAGIWGKGDVFFLKFDDLQRPIYVMNFRAVSQPTASDNRTSLDDATNYELREDGSLELREDGSIELRE